MRWLLIGSIVIVGYDAVLALGSHWFGYQYGAWWPGIVGSAVIVAAAAFMAARDRGMRRAGTATGAGVVVVDVVVGWPVSGAIIPGYLPGGSLADVVQTVILVALLGGAVGAVVGFVAGSLGVRFTKPRFTATG